MMVVVWLNGAFGVGKTSVARALVARLGSAMLFDPELLGVALQRLRFGRVDDFQDLSSWRRWTALSLKLASRVRSCVVVPMTVVDRAYFDEMVGTLGRSCEVRHFSLVAPEETIRERLRQRGEVEGSWAESQIDRCLAALSGDAFALHVPTADRSVEEIADDILAHLGFTGAVS